MSILNSNMNFKKYYEFFFVYIRKHDHN